MSPKPRRAWSVAVFFALLLLSSASYLDLARQGLTNLEGDGWAHLSIARRLWDSKTPGYYELGTVWLPLPHVLAAPFTAAEGLWRSGAAGSLVSVVAGAAAGFFFWRLLLLVTGSFTLALAGTALFAFNPNWLYSQTTPMTEPLLAFCFLTAVFYAARFTARERWRDLILAAAFTALAALTRYDGWFLIAVATLGIVAVARGSLWQRLGRAAAYGAMASSAPVYWFLHNAILFSDPFYFARGPDSARALYARQIAETGFRFPTDHNVWRAVSYYVEAARLNAGTAMVVAALAGLILLSARGSRAARLGAFLLLMPMVAYPVSLYAGQIAIYVPHLIPFTHFNIRYGLAVLPALVFLATSALESVRSRSAWWMLFALLLGQDAWLARHGLGQTILLKEARTNLAHEIEIANFGARQLDRWYDFGNILVHAGRNSGAIQRSHLSFRQTIYEGNIWQWDAARRFPLATVRWVLTRKGDPLWDWVRQDPAARGCFERVAEMPGELEIYRARSDAAARRAGLELRL